MYSLYMSALLGMYVHNALYLSLHVNEHGLGVLKLECK
jgi:hypothetical protein